MNKTVNNKNQFKKILNKLAAKRFSKNEKITLIVIIIILILFGNHVFNKWINSLKRNNNIIVSITPPIQPKLPDPIVIKKTDSEQKIEPQIKAEKIRDPFLSSKNPKKTKITIGKKTRVKLKLSGILWDNKIPSAIINSKVVEIGDLIAGKTVVDIERDKVIIMENGEIFVMELRKQ